MTEWLTTQKAAEGFFVLDECELRDTHEDGGIVYGVNARTLTTEEIATHLGIGKVAQLSLAWQDKLSFVLDDKMIIKRLRFESLLEDQAEADGGDMTSRPAGRQLHADDGHVQRVLAGTLHRFGWRGATQGINRCFLWM